MKEASTNGSERRVLARTPEDDNVEKDTTLSNFINNVECRVSWKYYYLRKKKKEKKTERREKEI